MTAFCSEDLGKGVVVISPSGMYRHAGRFVDYDQSLIFVGYPNRLGCYGRFVPVEGVGYDIAVFDDSL